MGKDARISPSMENLDKLENLHRIISIKAPGVNYSFYALLRGVIREGANFERGFIFSTIRTISL